MTKGSPDTSNSGNIVSFDNDGATERSTQVSKPLDDTLVPDNYPEKTLLQFLSRPVKWKQGTFSLTDSLTKPEFNVGHTLTGLLTDIPMWREKLRGYYGIRYDLKLRLILNANAHQQGLYRLVAIPIGDPRSLGEANVWANAHACTKYQRSMLPGVYIDLSQDTEVVLTVPYCSRRAFSLLNTVAPSQQLIKIYPFSILQTGTGANNCSWTLFASLENVQLFGQVEPQSAIDREQRSGKIGPIGSTLRKVSRASTILSRVPLLSVFAGTVSWASDIAAEVAYVFGFSRPTDLAVYQNHVQSILPGFSNYDVADRSKQLGLMARNQLELCPEALGHGEDEMDFKHFLSRYCYIGQFSWNLIDLVDTQKHLITLKPTAMSLLGPGGILPTYHHSPVSLLGEFFELYRGSFAFRLHFVKTGFHSGRLEVVFHPSSGGTMPVMSQDSPWVQKTIIDIRDRSTFDFEVPWISPNAFIRTSEPYGYLQINIVEELSCPDTVSSSIDVFIEMACCGDFEFAQYKPPKNAVPYFNVVPQSGLGDSKVKMTSRASALAIGETVRSWRQLLKIPSGFDYPLSKSTWKTFSVLPFGVQYPSQATTPVLTSSTVDIYGILSGMYLFAAGSVRLKGYFPTSKNFKVEVTAGVVPTGVSVYDIFYPNPFINDYPWTNPSWRISTPLAVTGEQEAVEVQIPQYGFDRVRNSIETISLPSSASSQMGYFVDEVSPACVNFAVDSTASFEGFVCYRSGGDDANFGTFVSIPPMTALKSWLG